MYLITFLWVVPAFLAFLAQNAGNEFHQINETTWVEDHTQ